MDIEYLADSLIKASADYFAIEQLRVDEKMAMTGPIVDLMNHIQEPHLASVKSYLYHAVDDLRSIFYAAKIVSSLLLEDDPDDEKLTTYKMRSFIQTFFLDSRSILDYMLQATLQLYSVEINQTTQSLRKQLGDPEHNGNFAKFLGLLQTHSAELTGVFGASLIETWSACTFWFGPFNSIRNKVTHGGHFLAVRRGNVDLFQIQTVDGNLPLVALALPPYFTVSTDGTTAVSFSAFSGLYTGLLLCAINDWSEALLVKIDKPRLNKTYAGHGSTACYDNIRLALTKVRMSWPVVAV
jgi:hypothetical protein